ncbi:MAG: protein tyrosine kinase [Pseudomonadota bacterium]
MSKVQKALKRIRDSRALAHGSRQEQQAEQSKQSSTKDVIVATVSPDAAAAARPEIEFNAAVQELDDPGFAPAADDTTELPKITLPSVVTAIDRDSLLEAGLLTGPDPDPAVATSYRRIKRPLIGNAFSRTASDKDCANVIMLTSAMPGAGKSFCSFGLAVSVAQERDIGAVLIDADVLKPTITRAFGLESRKGLTDFLTDEGICIDEILVQTDIDDIIVIPAGAVCEDSTELLASRRMKRFIQTLSRSFSDRLVVLDTPPMLITTEAQVLADHTGQVVLVVEAGVTAHSQMLEMLESLDLRKPVNAILNKSRNVATYQYGHDYYGYQGHRPLEAKKS